ncbi:MAG: trypsin-like peptidase domain-containing protein [Planctomycetes bacterium]|nr:trypsin-like peptidase domain-containing protein [Planctomycetota bacterium]
MFTPARPLRLVQLMALALLAAGCGGWAAEALPRPPVEDAFGLGERLALIDHLRTSLHVQVPDGATLDELNALYWRTVGAPVAATALGGGDADEQALARDRIARLRHELSGRHAIQAPADADEATLQHLLTEARTAAREQATQQARVEDLPAGGDVLSTAAAGNLKARADRAVSGMADRRERIEQIGRRRAGIAKAGQAAEVAIITSREAAEVAKRVLNAATDGVNGEVRSVGRPSPVTRKTYDDANDAYNAAVDACNRQLAARAALLAEDQAQERAQGRLAAEIDTLEKERSASSAELDQLQSQAAGRAGAARSAVVLGAQSAGDAGPAPTGFEATLKNAVVLVHVAGRGTGTGFFVTRGGLLVTNAHVVGDGTGDTTALWDGAVQHAPAHLRVLRVLPEDDLALLAAVGDGPFTALELKEVYELSRPTLAVGFPLASAFAASLKTSPSDIVISRGSLNAVRHQGAVAQWLQHDCKIASGNSGGPLIDQASGAVIGINSRVMNPADAGGHGDSMSLAIPIRKVMERFGADLKK